MEATTPKTYAVLDGAYWLDAADGDCSPCVHCALLHRSLAAGAAREPGQAGPAGQDGPSRRAGPSGQDVPAGHDVPYGQDVPSGQDVPYGQDGEDDQDRLLGRLRTALTCGNASTLRAVMLTCSVGTVIVGAAATLRR
ncbi:hypothetical protein [Streptomyces sp. NPDC048349]|uniref:hypothetical protein n=1 Tax=Streptomyces sp. NPDC048349 TaxID=3155486 RepID=UPI003436458E